MVIWAAVATLSAIACGFVANAKNRNASMWAAWGFVLPPVLVVLLLLPRNRGLRPVTPTFDEEDRRIEAP
ncbi:MAG: hypothetical protein HC868_11800 [Sphingomonadales bacterium]|nr:hypothetical protein [Sphingomonadales bacterium]